MRKIVWIVFFMYTSLLIYWMFFGFSRIPSEEYKYNFTPFSTIKNYFTYFSHFPFLTWIINIGGNIVVFIPFGIFLPCLFIKLRNVLSFLVVFLLGITILETSQLYFRVGSFDVDDIILNSVGALIGFVVYFIFRRTKS
ncbi:glycopeptide antibiotics resistance protein [Salirhabdus euzebyi]|uniref:Glycopeptide antibiotics resistance protein n=1 Tax=Salirhabdus euzebyi TaxID=394506 RepID=A0A841Q9G2_9BACI|nr:VanZ family protein [Salirhabdus euzebyi]MBB6454943.1 glycopeptide antibiotics resistance protein [Salirhabdus euzebyi]